MKSFFSKYGAYLAAIVLFGLASIVYCAPATTGKVLSTGDTNAYIGASRESRKYAAQTEGKGSWWTGSMFSGMPTYQIGGGARYKAECWLQPVNRVLHKGIGNPVWSMFIYFACFFILLLSFGISPWISLLGAMTIGLSSYFITLIPAGHNTKIACIALTAVVVAGFKFIFNGKYLLGAVLTMLFVSSGYSLHPQMFYYYFMMIALLWVAELWQHLKEKRIRPLIISTAIFVASVGIGVGTGCSNVLANSEYVRESTRGGSVLSGYLNAQESGDSGTKRGNGLNLGYATDWSNGVDETFTFLIPGFKGGATGCSIDKDSRFFKTLKDHHYSVEGNSFPVYWGPQRFTYGNTYVGAVVCFLFLLGLLIVKGPYKWMLLACTLFSILLSWGSNFMWLTELFYKYFPLYSKFRAVSSIQIVAEIAMPLLALLAVKELLDGTTDAKTLRRSVFISAGVTVGLCLFFLIAGGSLYSFTSVNDDFGAESASWLKPAVIEYRQSIFKSDCLRSMLFILASAAIVLLNSRLKKKSLALFMVLGVLSVVDLWGVDRRYFNDDWFVRPKHFASTFGIRAYEKAILQDKDPHFRVFNSTGDAFNDSRTSMYLKSVGGYSAAKLSRYDDLIRVHLGENHWPAFNMLNTKYIVVPGETFNENKEDVSVLINEAALGNAWFVNSVQWVDNPKDEIDDIVSVDLRNTAIVNEEFRPMMGDYSFGKSADSRIVLDKYRPDHLEYSSNTSCPGLAVFSEIYYPHGWEVRIDGKEQEHFRANYLLRALRVPAGSHKITFDFNPQSVRIGDGVAVFFIVLMYAIVAAALVYACTIFVKGRKKQ